MEKEKQFWIAIPVEIMALELLDEAMERAPRDPLPIATAAWCRGLRAGHHFTARPEVERAAASELAARAAKLNAGDALAETMESPSLQASPKIPLHSLYDNKVDNEPKQTLHFSRECCGNDTFDAHLGEAAHLRGSLEKSLQSKVARVRDTNPRPCEGSEAG